MTIPIGYETPRFPSLYWPLGENQVLFDNSSLYYFVDIWRFTMIWSLIFSTGVHLLVCLYIIISKINSKFKATYIIVIFIVYTIYGALQGFVAGSLMGLLLAAVYQASQFKLTTWIPLCWGLAVSIFCIISGYKFSVKFM